MDETKSRSRKRLLKSAKKKKLKKKCVSKDLEKSIDIVDEGRKDYDDDSESIDSDMYENGGFDDDSGQKVDFDIEAFPMQAGDRDGIVNMLTQIFLRADIDLGAFADSIISQSPFGMVIGPAEDQSDEDDENVVYGLLTVVPLSNSVENQSKFAKEVMDFLEKKSQKYALKGFRDAFEVIKTERSGLFINERMLNFPHQIVKPSFKSIRSDLAQLKKPYQRMVYVHKLRIAKQDTGLIEQNKPKKKKMGKAEKKRLSILNLSKADVVFDNIEDEILYKIDEGEAHYFDIPVHNEVDSSSKFHMLVKDGKSYMPYRRIVVMNMKRFSAWLEQVIDGNL